MSSAGGAILHHHLRSGLIWMSRFLSGESCIRRVVVIGYLYGDTLQEVFEAVLHPWLHAVRWMLYGSL